MSELSLVKKGSSGGGLKVYGWSDCTVAYDSSGMNGRLYFPDGKKWGDIISMTIFGSVYGNATNNFVYKSGNNLLASTGWGFYSTTPADSANSILPNAPNMFYSNVPYVMTLVCK